MEHRLFGNSVQIKELNETIKQVAPSNISVLITGESGTGKEVVANAIHRNSKRKSQSFIKVNCGAIPEGIIESELFGHQKGAFTGAIETRKGYFEMADNGTIFLDEIGEMPLSTQVKILRVLETGEFMRVGGDHNIFFIGIDENAMDYITNFVWYGNARELKNFAESIIVLNPNSRITLSEVRKHLERDIINSRSLPMVTVPKQEFSQDKDFILRALFELKTDILDLKQQIANIDFNKKYAEYNTNEDFFIPKEVIKTMTFEEIEKEILIYFLKNNNWNINKTAEMLEVTPRTIYRKIKLYDIHKN